MAYIDYEECRNAEIVHDCNGLILLLDKTKTPAMVYFAACDFKAVVKAIAGMPDKLRMHFVPRAYAPQLEALGFTEWGEFMDFWNEDLLDTASRIGDAGKAEYLSKDECDEASLVSMQCYLQSRGFEGAAPEFFLQSIDEGKVIVFRKDSAIAGFCSVSVINGGTTLWIRMIAVAPAHQGCGIGKKLVAQAIKYGVQNGAVKGFLASDVLYDIASGIYRKYDVHPTESERELQMIRGRA
jgi:ribosomal protein S18 acetylase RimI-like enzyme